MSHLRADGTVRFTLARFPTEPCMLVIPRKDCVDEIGTTQMGKGRRM